VRIECFVWTDYARMRLDQRGLDAAEVERAIGDRHEERQTNDGRAQWLVAGTTAGGTAFEAIYDHPPGNDDAAVRIVSVWSLAS
jgi:hypothetical protein